MQPTVVILLSDKRSGSTMFQRELCRHPAVQTVNYSPHTYQETHHWLKAAVMLNVAPRDFSGGVVYNGYGSSQNARTYMEDCVKGNVSNFDISVDDRALVFGGWEAMCRQYATPVFFEKSPQFLAHWGALELILEWIKSTDFNVKVVGLVRNPLSVMYSAQELFHSDPVKRQFGWMQIHCNLQRFADELEEGQFLLCRYEDIISDAVSFFEKICRFIGVGPVHSVGAEVHGDSVNKWESDPCFALQLDPSVKEMALFLGYNSDDLRNPEKPVPPITHRIKVRLNGWLRLTLSRFMDRIVRPAVLRRKNR
jgi:hypothetical protein